MNFGYFLLATAAVVGAAYAYGDDEYIGPNVCSTISELTEARVLTEYRTVQTKTPYLCLDNWLFLCFTVSEKQVPIMSRRIPAKYGPVQGCCEGYKEMNTPGGIVCTPNCEPACVEGECVEPNKCRCNEFVGGQFCNETMLIDYTMNEDNNNSVVWNSV